MEWFHGSTIVIDISNMNLYSMSYKSKNGLFTSILLTQIALKLYSK